MGDTMSDVMALSLSTHLLLELRSAPGFPFACFHQLQHRRTPVNSTLMLRRTSASPVGL